MLDSQFIIDNMDAVRCNCINRCVDPNLINRFVALESEIRQCQFELEQLQKRQNEIAYELRESVILAAVE